MPKALAPESTHGPMELAPLLADDMRTESAIGSGTVAFVADSLRQIEDDGHRQDVIFAGKRHERLTRLRLNVRGVDYGESSAGQPTRCHEVKRGKRISGCRLIVLIV